MGSNADSPGFRGQDVFVPWVLTEDGKKKCQGNNNDNKVEKDERVFNRYYHMFEEGELRELVLRAARELGMCTSEYEENTERTESETAIEIVKDDWERSNYYLEFRLYQR